VNIGLYHDLSVHWAVNMFIKTFWLDVKVCNNDIQGGSKKVSCCTVITAYYF